MSATAANIQRATRQARIVKREDSAIKTAFPFARDQIGDPEPGYFEDAADAADALDIKAALTGARRRRVLFPVPDLIWIDPTAGVPTWHLEDVVHTIDDDALPTRLLIDLETEQTTIEAMI